MTRLLRMLFGLLAYAAFALAVGYLSFWPRYQYSTPGLAVLKLSLSHATKRVEPCVPLTPEEIAELARNMQRTEICERERLPLVVELEIDGKALLQTEAAPSGLWGDGPAYVYHRFDVEPGPHRITASLRDTARTDGWDYTRTEDVVLEAGRYFTVTFKAETGDFDFR